MGAVQVAGVLRVPGGEGMFPRRFLELAPLSVNREIAVPGGSGTFRWKPCRAASSSTWRRAVRSARQLASSSPASAEGAAGAAGPALPAARWPPERTPAVPPGRRSPACAMPRRAARAPRGRPPGRAGGGRGPVPPGHPRGAGSQGSTPAPCAPVRAPGSAAPRPCRGRAGSARRTCPAGCPVAVPRGRVATPPRPGPVACAAPGRQRAGQGRAIQQPGLAPLAKVSDEQAGVAGLAQDHGQPVPDRTLKFRQAYSRCDAHAHIEDVRARLRYDDREPRLIAGGQRIAVGRDAGVVILVQSHCRGQVRLKSKPQRLVVMLGGLIECAVARAHCREACGNLVRKLAQASLTMPQGHEPRVLRALRPAPDAPCTSEIPFPLRAQCHFSSRVP